MKRSQMKTLLLIEGAVCLTLTLTLNPDFDPTESDFASEFESDAPEVIPTQDEEEAEKNGTN